MYIVKHVAVKKKENKISSRSNAIIACLTTLFISFHSCLNVIIFMRALTFLLSFFLHFFLDSDITASAQTIKIKQTQLSIIYIITQMRFLSLLDTFFHLFLFVVTVLVSSRHLLKRKLYFFYDLYMKTIESELKSWMNSIFMMILNINSTPLTIWSFSLKAMSLSLFKHTRIISVCEEKKIF